MDGMKSLPSLLLFMLLIMAAHSEVPVPLNDDVLGLIVFKSALRDASSALESWSEDENSPCAWKFIKCSPANGRVSQVLLDGLGLSGKIGRGLEKLQNLKVLSLANNNLSGSVSPQISLSNGLEKLNLSGNAFDGAIPFSLSNITSIQFLDLSQNSFSGPLPDNLFANCKSLRFVSLAANKLEGPFPETLSECTSLNHVNLSNNHLSGDPGFKAMFQSLTRLRTLDLSNNELSGEMPFGISALHNLKELLLKGNHFSGSIPADIGFCPHFSRIDFSGNFFSGKIPGSLRFLNELVFLSASQNLLSGDFPQWINKLSSLEYLDFSENSLQGILPESIGEMNALNFIALSNNRLSGAIPKGLFELGLDEVDLSGNQLTGPIPSGSSKLVESLEMLDLSGNNLTGEFPATMGQYLKLVYLNLSLNSFGSELPPQLGHCKNLTVVDLRSSALTGSVPGGLCESGSIRILQLDENSLTGSLPDEIANCSSLSLLSLSHNNLTGPIPESISSLKKLKILKLEFNQLSGEIPRDLGQLENLLAVNISYNRLIGRLPDSGIFPSLDSSALEGNSGICSPLLKGPCKLNIPKPLVLDPNAYGNHHGGHRPEDDSPTGVMDFDHHRRFLSISAIIAISAAVAIAVGVIIITLINASVRKKLAFISDALESKFSRSSSNRSNGIAAGKLIMFDSKSSPEWITNGLETMLNKATEIGGGVYGTVYRAPLGGEGTVVAIKKLVTSNIVEYPEDFDREVRILGKARHQNLNPVRGYYWTPQLQFIVSDYAPEGSLRAKLHERQPNSAPLTWASRFKIVLGTARGLAYLHHSLRPPIIHYNIKPSNILLDDHMNPRISDFGLARLLTRLDQHVMSNRFQNAVGYVAPELACQSLRVNEKCDVFGFGVLILEIVSGKRAVEYGEDNVVILCDCVRTLLEQGNLLDCVDPYMGSFPDEEVLPVLKLALVCTSQIPSSRPSMEEVVQILQVINTPSPQPF